MSTLTVSAVVAADKVLTEDTVRPGLIGLFFFVALAVATYFLWRSMNRHLKKVDAHFVDVADTEGPNGAAETILDANVDDAAERDAP